MASRACPGEVKTAQLSQQYIATLSFEDIDQLKMLCDLCVNLDLDLLLSEEGMKHHASREDLESSARNGCPLCSIVSNGESEPVRESQDAQAKVFSVSDCCQIICKASADKETHVFYSLMFSQPNIHHSPPLNVRIFCSASEGEFCQQIMEIWYFNLIQMINRGSHFGFGSTQNSAA